ncbi:MAG: type II toxin-antitoxin system VapC family toxin [Pseudanabaena sp. M090S1SP1A06QC]|nr:type II toxin-antitoxin system VapC family toxin [Pseudanabaena sp. M051S1SP1A06QC]MCA6590299.1 type II toxin-antitoxin system VapC family toxin [Pseudanabaena sp. M109S1SP1A06QC]MCA6606700.1 type II toxin-antitoxin system VapC family toxin [Pseudanabaena sp. M007S1SP1A06QC]MCA6614066.1 type II toxin-antitoxin system VapC family toxin [Pseudanabaena sp. M090S1SP1A06QC]MCA6624873.1 type II toxin-antitoxin system VapC family toxin [Pseudanabaena sp. M165S2SP1A06QC]
MMSVVADTHTIIWYLRSPEKLSTNAVNALDNALNNGESIFISAISLVEMNYLVEKNRIPTSSLEQLLQLIDDPLVNLVVIPLDTPVAKAFTQIPRKIVPEMGDRIIAATALYLGLPLVTKDHKISNLSNIQIVW